MTQQGRIDVTQLEIETIVGAYPREREVLQTIYLDLGLEYDFASPANSDELALAIDYDALTQDLAKLIQAKRFKLLETLTLVAADSFAHPLSIDAGRSHRPQTLCNGKSRARLSDTRQNSLTIIRSSGFRTPDRA